MSEALLHYFYKFKYEEIIITTPLQKGKEVERNYTNKNGISFNWASYEEEQSKLSADESDHNLSGSTGLKKYTADDFLLWETKPITMLSQGQVH